MARGLQSRVRQVRVFYRSRCACFHLDIYSFGIFVSGADNFDAGYEGGELAIATGMIPVVVGNKGCCEVDIEGIGKGK